MPSDTSCAVYARQDACSSACVALAGGAAFMRHNSRALGRLIRLVMASAPVSDKSRKKESSGEGHPYSDNQGFARFGAR